MDRPGAKLDFMPRAQFAELSLHEKNAYLQDLARRFSEATDRPVALLSQDALARLRRFYARRSFADLKIESLPRDPLNDALRRLGEAIKADERKKDIVGGLVADLPPPVLREAPRDDAQLSFFVPVIYDAPIKDDVNLMDVAPFSLSKTRREGVITYHLKDGTITIDGSAGAGLATAFDYDIFLHKVSYMAEEAKQYRIALSKGRKPDLPARVYRPNVAHILKFCRRNSGGKQYKDMEAALDRLAGTRIKIVNLAGGKRREVINMPLIQSYKVISKTTTGHVDEVEIGVPDWVYNGIVKEEGHPHILTINPDYFLISQSIGRVIYRLARKAAGKNKAEYGLAELHKRSGSTQARPQFAQMLKRFVASTKMFPFPDYDLDLVDGRDEPKLVMRYRDQTAQLAA
jgi:plasmid replication initiation protein